MAISIIILTAFSWNISKGKLISRTDITFLLSSGLNFVCKIRKVYSSMGSDKRVYFMLEI